MEKNAWRYCRFSDCKNTSNVQGIHFYRFPKEEERCKAWVKACKNEKLVGVPASELYKRAHLCMDHFEDWCFMNITKKHRLVHNAVPCCSKSNVASIDPPSDVSSFAISTITNDSDNDSSLLKQLLLSPVPSQVSSTFSGMACSAKVPSMSTPIPSQNLSSVLLSVEASSSHVCQLDTSCSPAPIAPAMNICSTPKSDFSARKRKYTPRKAKLAGKIKQYRDSLRKYKIKFASLERERKNNHFLRGILSKRGVTEKLSTFIQRQVELNTMKKNARRFTEYEKINAYRIFCKSRTAYAVLKETLELPTEKTLQRFVSSKLSVTGISSDLICALKKVLSGKPEHERQFALIFDEMSLKPFLVYDMKKDHVVGFEDFSEGLRTNNVANHALVLMLRTLKGRKKLPISFYFSSYNMNAEKLQGIVMKALSELYHAGAVIKVFICDQGGNNIRFFSMLGADASKPYFEFDVHKVFCMFDPPHLLKNLRRNLMKYNLETNKGLIRFQHIRDFFAEDQKLLLRCAPRLTEAHINSIKHDSMKVSLSAQLFSHSVAAGMNVCMIANLIQASAAPTVEFVMHMNHLFDTLNGTSKNPQKGNEYHCAVKEGSVHLNFWKEMLEFIGSWKFVHPDGNSGQKPGGKRKDPGPLNKKGWLQTINGMIQLSEEMLANREFFMTKRCNQDCLENFFSRIRGCGGNRTNPSAYEFATAFKLASVNSLSSSNKFSNCEPDKDKFMFYLLSSASQSAEDETEEEENQNEDDFDNRLIIDLSGCDDDDATLQETSFDSANFLSQNVIAFLSGYISRRVMNALKLHECNVCQSSLVDSSKPMLQHTMFLHFKEYRDDNADGGLIHPSYNMTKCIAALMESAETFLSSHLSSYNLVKQLKSLLSCSPMLKFINCNLHANIVKEKIIHFSSLLSLKIHLREQNRKIKKYQFDLKQLRNINK